jgi:hypothetical protein
VAAPLNKLTIPGITFNRLLRTVVFDDGIIRKLFLLLPSTERAQRLSMKGFRSSGVFENPTVPNAT